MHLRVKGVIFMILECPEESRKPDLLAEEPALTHFTAVVFPKIV